MVKVFTQFFGYEHLASLSTPNVEDTHLRGLRNWFLQKDSAQKPLRSSDDLVVIYYSGHGDRAYDKDLRLVAKETGPADLLSTGIDPRDLLRGWIDSPVRHIWLILDVCHSGAVMDGLPEITKHLESGLEVQQTAGRSFQVFATCRSRQSAVFQSFAEGLRKTVSTIQKSDFGGGDGFHLESLLNQMQVHAPAQRFQYYRSGEIAPAFLPYASWKNKAFAEGADHATDAGLHEADLQPLIQILDTLQDSGWPPSWFFRLLPDELRLQQLGKVFAFKDNKEFVYWFCGLPYEGGTRICPLTVLAFRALLASTGIVSTPAWLTDIARWRGADLNECRDLASQEEEKYQTHARQYDVRIKLIGVYHLDAAGSGASDKVDYEIWHDFEDSHGKMILPLDQWTGIPPDDKNLGHHLEVFAANCPEGKSPVFQVTLPIDLLNVAVESIPVEDGSEKKPLGTVYSVILTASERDFKMQYSESRNRRHRKRSTFWQGGAETLEYEELKATEPLPSFEGRHVIATLSGFEISVIRHAINEGLPVILWSRAPGTPPPLAAPWTSWHKKLAGARREMAPPGMVLIWDDPVSGLRHLPAQTRLRVPPRRPN